MSGGSSNTPQTNFLQKHKEFREQQMLQQRSSASSPQASQRSHTSQSPPSPQSPNTLNNNNVYTPDKPPIPPRGQPPAVPVRQMSSDGVTVTLRTRTGKTLSFK